MNNKLTRAAATIHALLSKSLIWQTVSHARIAQEGKATAEARLVAFYWSKAAYPWQGTVPALPRAVDRGGAQRLPALARLLLLTALALFLLMPLAGSAFASSVGPVYCQDYIITEEGLSEDLRYSFPSGSMDVAPGRTLLMVNGEFLPHLVEIRENRSLVPLRYVTQAFGTAVEWDGAARAATLTLGETVVVIHEGRQMAEVDKGGRRAEQDLYTIPLIIDDRLYVPIRALVELFDKSIEYETGLAPHPIVWIDDVLPGWEPDIEGLQASCRMALDALKENIDTISGGIFGPWNLLYDMVYQEIAKAIDDMAVLRYVGRYAVVSGPHTMLVAEYGSVYFFKTVYGCAGIYEASFSDPEAFIEGYFAG